MMPCYQSVSIHAPRGGRDQYRGVTR